MDATIINTLFNHKPSFSSIPKSQRKQSYDVKPIQHMMPKNKESMRHNASTANIKKKSKPQSTINTNNIVIQHIINNIQSNERQSKKSLCSLYQMFDSDYFNIHLLINYLDAKESIGIVDTLANLMHTKYINQTYFYIPQLCNLIISKPYSESLEEFLLDCCINKIKFSIKVSWLINNYIKKSTSSAKVKYVKLKSKIEMTLINQRRREKFNNNNSITGNKKNSMNEVYRYYVNKEYQLSYFDNNIRCFNDLKQMCDSLKEIDSVIGRKNELKKTLHLLNKTIESMYDVSEEIRRTINTKTKNFYRGFILPFDDSDNINDEYNNVIVHFVPEYSMCFKTKARVPVRIVVECVRAYECENWSKLYNPPSFNTISNVKPKKEEENNSDNINNAIKNIFNISNEIEESLCDEKHYQFNPFNEKWSEIIKNIKEKTFFSKFTTYSVKAFIIKTNDDLNQEMMTMQLIKLFHQIFTQAKLSLQLTPYEILITSHCSGLIEFLPNTMSIDSIKKKILSNMNLNIFFRNYFCDNFEEAQKNFVESLAAYSLITYVIGIKDRHNGNILLDMTGHIIHIDYGFILGQSPGYLHFETAPFKLTSEYIEIMNGISSGLMLYFKTLLIRGMIEMRKYVESFVKIIEITAKSKL